jgi:putative ABC transport system substrate-binding protein
MGRKQWALVFVFAVASSGLISGGMRTAEGAEPIRIGVLTPAWGHPPQVIGLRDGLRKLGYREPEQFVLGVRFTRGNLAALPAAARELVKYGVDLIVATDGAAAMAAQAATDRIPIVFAGLGDPLGLGLV